MSVLVIYESMYGNTHAIADRLAAGLQGLAETKVVPVTSATATLVAWADLVLVGGPTHAHGLTTMRTRTGAREAADKPNSGLVVDPKAAGTGLRDWFRTLEDVAGKPAAAYDTRFAGPAMLTGQASRGIARRLRAHGFRLVAEPESFLVDRHNRLLAGEPDRAGAWAAGLCSGVVGPSVTTTPPFKAQPGPAFGPRPASQTSATGK